MKESLSRQGGRGRPVGRQGGILADQQVGRHTVRKQEAVVRGSLMDNRQVGEKGAGR